MPTFVTPGPIAAGSSLAAHLAYSSVHADGPLGQCELHLATGQVQLDRLDALQANVSAGEVATGHIAGRADIKGGAFAIRIGEAEGPVGLSSSDGRAWIGHAAADLDLRSGRGDFDIDRADGSVTATTASGAIRVGRLTAGPAKLTNGSGDIEVGIGEGTAADLDVNSERGAVRNSVPSPENPASSDNRVAVHARTRHGDIIIHPAAS